jgi:pyruvate,water dikinase
MVIWFERLTQHDGASVGGKNASLGEMIQHLAAQQIRVPAGFAVTAHAFRQFLAFNALEPVLRAELDHLALGKPLAAVGRDIRTAIGAGALPPALDASIRDAYTELGRRGGQADVAVAVRSSATAEDLPDASFAGQQESFLNVVGIEALLAAVVRCYASLYTDRAITYRAHHGFDHLQVALSVGVQRMVRADLGVSGVAFTLDTETGFRNTIVINGTWGLGENIVQGVVTPDEWRVFTPLLETAGLVPILDRRVGSKLVKMVLNAHGTPTNVDTTTEERARLVLSDARVLELARWCAQIEAHYGRPMDIEWAIDGETDELFIVQARPETVRAREDAASITTFSLEERGTVLASGVAVGQRITSGRAFVLASMADAARFEDGGVLVARMTDPDWVPLMKRASAIVTDAGGRTSHAAIVSRELGIAALVGTVAATTSIPDGAIVTVSCADGPVGHVYDGALRWTEASVPLATLPETRTQVMLNIADPEAAMRWWRLPARGVGLARIEFVIEHMAKVHPMALLQPERVSAADRETMAALTEGYETPSEYFVDRMASGIATIAASQWPHPVIVRFSDFKTNEYAELVGGRAFEPHEENPMLGFRGASRYYSAQYRDGFGLECQAIRRVRERLGFRNVIVMVPFCRTLDEADRVLAEMERHGLVRGEHGLEVYVMAEIPSNIILAREFGARFDGFSIGSNDLTQLTLGVDRDNALLADLFDERNAAVQRSIERLIADAHAVGCKVGICGQAPSDHPEFAEFLVRAGIDSISLNPDSVVPVLARVAALEAEMVHTAAATPAHRTEDDVVSHG